MAAEADLQAPATQPATAAPVAATKEPRTPEPGPAKAAEGAKRDARKKDAKKGGKASGKDAKKAAKGAPGGGDGPSVAAHPRAARGVARAKSWGALAGFVLGGYLSLPTNTLAGAGLRALIAGSVCYVAVWAGAVFLWRRLVVLEIKGREQQLAEAARAAARREPAGVERSSARAST
jgi:hypothetical protein